MKLLIAAVFAVISYTAVAADAPVNVQPTIAAAPTPAPAAKDEAKPAKKAHKHHHHKKHMKHENMKSNATIETPVK